MLCLATVNIEITSTEEIKLLSHFLHTSTFNVRLSAVVTNGLDEGGIWLTPG